MPAVTRWLCPRRRKQRSSRRQRESLVASSFPASWALPPAIPTVLGAQASKEVPRIILRQALAAPLAVQATEGAAMAEARVWLSVAVAWVVLLVEARVGFSSLHLRLPAMLVQPPT